MPKVVILSAIAIVYVGGFGAWFQARATSDKQELGDVVYNQMLYGFLAVGLSVLEVGCFLVFRFLVERAS